MLTAAMVGRIRRQRARNAPLAAANGVADVVRRNDQLALADELMREGGIRHLVVLEADELPCAVLSQRDIFRGALMRALGFGGRAEERVLKQVVVKEAIGGELYTIAPDAPVAEAARAMLDKHVSCLPVLEDGKLVGIVTATDLVRLVADAKQ